jgi:hypothetical protein
VVFRVFWVDNHRTPAVITENPPARCTLFEVAILEELSRRIVGRLDHSEVVDKNFTGVEKTDDELVPLARAGE